jgi:WD40 repeat protein
LEPTGEALRPSSVRAFISYARSDGEEFAARLRARLLSEEPEITLWQDRSSLEGGVGWWKQIAEALSSVQFLILIMTPASIESPMVQKEWRLARQQGVTVYPVKGVSDAELAFDKMPRWMRKAHFFDLAKEWQTFVNYLKSPSRAARVPFMAPSLPEKFVPRREATDAARLALMRGEGAVSLTTSLQGAGGLGKTTLAIALCHDEEVLETFDDGILWVSLGKAPRVIDELAKLYVALTGKRPGFIDEEDAAFHLAQELQDKHCLVVIDDVWNARHLEPFLRGGITCTRLITTRLANIAPGGEKIRVDEMKSAEAVALLADRLTVSDSDRPALKAFAKRLGEWPLLLELANAQLRRRIEKGDDMRGALAHLNRKLDKQGIVAFDERQPEVRQDAIAKTIELSLDAFDKGERAVAVMLAVFPEDARIPIELVQAMWDLDELETEELVALLDDFALVRFDVETGTMTVHDVIRAYFATQVADANKAHSRLADLAHALSGDAASFAWRWRSYHLRMGGRGTELRSELLNFESLMAKLLATDVTALIADFDSLEVDFELQCVLDAIKLAVPVVAEDPRQMPAQLLGRLPVTADRPQLHEFRCSIQAWNRDAWLRPLNNSLTVAGGPMLATLAGHGGPVLDVALESTGSRAITASTDGTLRVWDWRHSSCLRVLEGHLDAVRAVAILERDSIVISASDDGTIRTWDLESGDALEVVETGGERISRIRALPDQPHCVAIACGRRVLLWQLGTAWAPRILIEHSERVHTLEIAPSGVALSIAEDRRLGGCLLASNANAVLTETLPVPLVAAAADAEGSVTISADGVISTWSHFPRLLKTSEVRSHIFRATCAAKLRGGKLLVGSEDATLRVVDVSSGMIEQTLEGHNAAINAVRVSDDGSLAISISDDATLRVWDSGRGSAQRALGPHSDAVRALTFSPDGKYVFSTADFGEVICWDVESGKQLESARGFHSWDFDIDAGHKFAVLAMPNQALHCWSVSNSNVGLVREPGGSIRALHFDVGAGRTVLVDTRGSIDVWDVARATKLLTLHHRNDYQAECRLSFDGEHVVAAGEAGGYQVWNLQSATCRNFQFASGRVSAISRDGARAVFIGSSDELTLVVGAAEPLALGKHRGVNATAFSGSGRTLASCGADNTLRVWDAARLNQQAAFTFEDEPSTCAMSPDGITAVAGDVLGRVHFFRNVDGSQVAA